MSEKELTGKESLDIITSMIHQAKSNYRKGGSFYFLLWGWVVMVANLAHYGLSKFTDFPYPYIVWLVTIPAAAISAIHGIRQRKTAPVKGHLDRLYGQVWIGIGIAIVVILYFMKEIHMYHNSVILLLSAVGTYISGQILRFKPLVIGAVVLMLTSVVSFTVTVTDSYLVGGIGIFAGYLIPGYLLKRTEK